MHDLNLRPDAGRSVGVGMRNKELEHVDVLCIAAALSGGAGINKERHYIKTVTDNTERQRRHTAILSFLNSGFVGQRETLDLNRRNAYSRSDLYHAGSDEASFVFLLDKRVPEYSSIPVFCAKIIQRHCADLLPVALATFKDVERARGKSFDRRKRRQSNLPSFIFHQIA